MNHLAVSVKTRSIIKNHNIGCDFLKRSAFSYSVSSGEAKKINEEYQAAKSLGLPVSVSADLKVSFPANQAIVYENQAQFHPRKFLLGIAKVLIARGVKMHENTRAISMAERKVCQIKTDRGQISAKKVIITTNNQFQETKLYSELVFPYHSFVTAYKTDRQMVDGMYYSDEDGAYSIRAHRTNNQDYLLVGGEGIINGQPESREQRLSKLAEYAKKYFSVGAPAYNWQAQDNISYDLLPLIGYFTPESRNVFVATGFSAWGMTKSVVAAKLLSDIVVAKENPWQKIYDPWSNERSKVRREAGEMFKRKSFSSSDQKNRESGEGRIITENGEQIAIFKTSAGTEIRLSPICTHKGCIVGWNRKDQSWDCPCHGSRFDAHGKVIHGPAAKDLERK